MMATAVEVREIGDASFEDQTWGWRHAAPRQAEPPFVEWVALFPPRQAVAAMGTSTAEFTIKRWEFTRTPNFPWSARTMKPVTCKSIG